MSTAHEQEWALEGDAVEAPQNETGGLETEVEANEAPELTDVEKLAQEMGWKPADQWKGDKSTHVDAETYLRSTYNRQRDASRHVRAANQRADEYQARLDRLERTANQMMSEQEQRHRAELTAYYERAKKEAAKVGDEERWEELIDEQRQAEALLDRKFQKEAPVNYEAQAQEMLSDPIVGRFLKEHPWVVQDEDAYAYAFSVAQDYADAGAPKSEQIRAVKAALRDEFPQYFAKGQGQQRQAPQRQAPQAENQPAPWDVDGETAERETPVKDPATGRFVPKQEAHLYQQPAPQRRAAPVMQSGSRQPNQARMATPEAKAWNSLPPEARSVFQAQKKSGAFKGDIVKFAKIYSGDQDNVID
jgi:hypothetical protein